MQALSVDKKPTCSGSIFFRGRKRRSMKLAKARLKLHNTFTFDISSHSCVRPPLLRLLRKDNCHHCHTVITVTVIHKKQQNHHTLCVKVFMHVCVCVNICVHIYVCVYIYILHLTKEAEHKPGQAL